MSSFCKSHFFSKNISKYAIFNNQSFNDMLTINIVSFEQLGPDIPFIQSYVLVKEPASVAQLDARPTVNQDCPAGWQHSFRGD